MLEVVTAKMAFHQSTKQKGNNSFPESKGDYIVPSFITTGYYTNWETLKKNDNIGINDKIVNS